MDRHSTERQSGRGDSDRCPADRSTRSGDGYTATANAKEKNGGRGKD
jgi:hypothetical protein